MRSYTICNCEYRTRTVRKDAVDFTKQSKNCNKEDLIVRFRRILHLVHYAPKEENAILFVGFQAAGTRGDRLLKYSEKMASCKHEMQSKEAMSEANTIRQMIYAYREELK